jgi:predicted AlkP superfamily phosphohydrolase/phosphomutase
LQYSIQHGVFDFFRPHTADLDRYEMVNSTHSRGKHLWEYLSAAGKRVGVLNVPVTHPPRPVLGYLVPGLLSPDEGQTCYPPRFLEPYVAELGPYRLTPQVLYDGHNTAEFIADLRDLCHTQSQYAQHLYRDHPTDFFMVHFLAPDIAQHKLWHLTDPSHPRYQPAEAAQYGSALRDLFIQLDQAITDLIAQMPADTVVVVMSDHGFGPLHEIVNLNQFFIQTGLMRLKQNWQVKARQWLFGRPLLWRAVRRWLRPPAFADVDWSQTVAYALGHIGQVYLNVRGRQPHGIVEREAYEAVRAQVMAQLRQLRHPATQQLLVSELITREEAGQGAYVDHGPDLHVVLDGYRATAYPMFSADGRVVTTQRAGNSGDHRRMGMFIAAGPPIASGQTFADAHLVDIAPTLLYLLGVPVPDDMDGRVLWEAITPAHRAAHPLHMQAGETAVPPSATAQTGDDIVAQRLRDLGYMG